MTRRFKVFPELKDAQAQASDPAAHAALSASAGTGKTQVLTARVLRLLLQGAQNMVKPKVQTAQAPPQTTASSKSLSSSRRQRAVPHGILKNARQAAKLHVTGSMAGRA